MKIKATTLFLDGADRFEAGDERTVPDERGAYFVANGWAEDVAGRVATGEAEAAATTDLNINNSGLGLGDSNG